jgi:hypothetical protein
MTEHCCYYSYQHSVQISGKELFVTLLWLRTERNLKGSDRIGELVVLTCFLAWLLSCVLSCLLTWLLAFLLRSNRFISAQMETLWDEIHTFAELGKLGLGCVGLGLGWNANE